MKEQLAKLEEQEKVKMNRLNDEIRKIGKELDEKDKELMK